MKCGHCGNEVANPESGYCPYCGRKLGKDAETPEKPSGNENTPSERYVVNDNGNKTDPKVKILIGALSATIIVLLGIIIIGRPKKSIAIASNDSISEKQEDAAETETVAEADQTDVQSNEGYVVYNDKALENEIRLSCASAVGSAKDVIDVDIAGESVEIGFNNKYMLDALKNTDTDEVKLVLNGPVSPIIVKPVSGDSFLSIVVPMRLANEN